MQQVDPLDIEIPENCMIVLIQKINAGRRLRVFKNLGEAGKQVEHYEDYAVIIPNNLLHNPDLMIDYADSVEESERVEIGKILSRELSDG